VSTRVLVAVIAYNEASNLESVITELRAGCDYDLVVIDNGSTDETAATARRMGVPCVSHCVNTGGSMGTVKTYFQYAWYHDYDVLCQFDASGAVSFVSTFHYGESPPPPGLRPEILDRAATRVYVLSERDGLARALNRRGALGRRGFRRAGIQQPEGVQVFERTGALPRARFAADVQAVEGVDQALFAMGLPGSDPRRTVLEPAEGEPARRPAAPARGTVRVLLDEPERIELEDESDGPGYLVLADTYYPGWHATVDGSQAPIHAADVLFRAVGAAAWLLLGALALGTRRRAGPEPAPAGAR
jgi:hypothetical protein